MKVLTFGEIMLRLRAPGHERFFQSNMMEATFGGGEANVAVSLANYGMDSEYFTVLPNNDMGSHCINELHRFGVDTKNHAIHKVNTESLEHRRHGRIILSERDFRTILQG